MGIRSSVFSGPSQLMAMGHPFVSPAAPPVMGVPIGIDVFSRELVYFDPWLLKDHGVINSAFGMFLGPKGFGKSSAMKILALRLMLIAAGYKMMRVAINDYKPEGSDSEYAAFSKACRSRVFRINDMSVNIFEPRLFVNRSGDTNVLAVLEVAQMVCEYINGSSLRGLQGTALRIGVYKMLSLDPLLWSPHALLKLLLSITAADVDGYYQTLDSRIMGQLESRLSSFRAETKETVEAHIREVSSRTNNVHIADIQAAGEFVASLLDTVLNGSYGHMFGNRDSLYDVLTQRAVTKDWRDVQPEAETLMRAIDARIKGSAIEGNRLDLLPHIELDDEKHKSMGNLVYAETHAYFSEIARGTHTCNLSATHRFNSIRKGGTGSHLQTLAENIIDNLGFVFIGWQPNKKDILGEIQDRYALSDADTRELTRLPKYTFAVKLGEQQKVRFVRIFATPAELAVLGTNAATDRMVDRPAVYNRGQLARFAAENGLAYLGADDAYTS